MVLAPANIKIQQNADHNLDTVIVSPIIIIIKISFGFWIPTLFYLKRSQKTKLLHLTQVLPGSILVNPKHQNTVSMFFG